MKLDYYSITRLLHAMCNTINTVFSHLGAFYSVGITVLHESADQIKKTLQYYEKQRILNFQSLSEKIIDLQESKIFKHTGFSCNTVILTLKTLIINSLNQCKVLHGHVIPN